MVQKLHMRRKRIMVVDDDECSRKIIISFLEQTYDVVSVSSAIEALEYLEENTVDLFLIDIMMPVIDGKHLFLQLNKIERLRNIPIIFQTSVTDSKTVKECIELGATWYLVKPIKKDELLHRIEYILKLGANSKWKKKQVNHILYIDRNELNFGQMETMLKEKFKCTSAAGVIHTLNLIERGNVDLVLINMDNAGSYFDRVLAKIDEVNKKREKNKKIHIVAATYKKERYFKLEREAVLNITVLKLPLSKQVLVESLLYDL